MKIAILSDSHDNLWNLKAALTHVQHTDALIFCGDISAPFMLALMAKVYKKPIHMVFGNNDGDRYNLLTKANDTLHVKLHGEVMNLTLGDKRFYVNHYPEIALEVARSGDFDVVCFGHNHEHSILQNEDSLIINPGTILGFAPRKMEECPATFVVYDTVTNRVESFEIKDKNGDKRVVPYGN